MQVGHLSGFVAGIAIGLAVLITGYCSLSCVHKHFCLIVFFVIKMLYELRILLFTQMDLLIPKINDQNALTHVNSR